MPYSNYTLLKMEQRFGIKHQVKPLFVQGVESIPPSVKLLADLEEANELPDATEKAKSENIIAPILKEVRKRHTHQLTYFSGYQFDVDENLELNGYCDYLLVRQPNLIEVRNPVICVVEAKNRTLEEGYGQCAAEMYACQLFNEQNGEPTEPLYGCVTNAYEWIFLKLENNTLYIDKQRYFLDNVPNILGVFECIIKK